MQEYHFLLKKLFLVAEFISAIVGLLYIVELKKSYWKWFSLYLFFIMTQEFFWYFNSFFPDNIKQGYYAFIGIPIQYLFLFWLYAYKSLKNKKLLFYCIVIYLTTYIPVELFFKKIDVVYSINLTMGTLLLAFLIVLEFLKQIKDDSIINFEKNKMFYITIGIILSYIGTYPFFCFYNELWYDHRQIWQIYFAYFLCSNTIMYLLFTASYIWGKRPLS
ncbi:hypothetical protein [Aquimarina algicola]|uniref:Histidine kinase n=1 Tax=Aquimarina algicola TaxID=2589995 RepID=A0A504JH93_9FLAO|nr:hypothetical protein [Aquimarina algicola]TPN87775.1 hypothetical protein FHK87_09380 [Aquimarina algicola]